jgi:peroxiredoxin
VIQHVLNTIGGNGVPDYPEPMTEILKKILDDFTVVAVNAATNVEAPTSSTQTTV